MKSVGNWVKTSYRRWVIENRNNKLMKYYEKGRYEDIARLFKTETDYLEIKEGEFPFFYYMIGQGNIEAVITFLSTVPFKDYLLFDEKNPLKVNALLFAYL